MKALACLIFAALAWPPSSPAADRALLTAIREDDAAAVQALLAAGADANLRDETGATALMYAALYSSPATMRLLLDTGADVNAANGNGSTALMWAAGNTAKVRLLLDRGAAFDARTTDGTTPLLAAAYRGNSEAMQLLLSRRSNPK